MTKKTSPEEISEIVASFESTEGNVKKAAKLVNKPAYLVRKYWIVHKLIEPKKYNKPSEGNNSHNEEMLSLIRIYMKSDGSITKAMASSSHYYSFIKKYWDFYDLNSKSEEFFEQSDDELLEFIERKKRYQNIQL